METPIETHIAMNRMAMERHVSGLYDKPKNIIKQDAFMKFYGVSQPQYLEKDSSGVGLGAGPLQARNSINIGQDGFLENTALCPMTFTSKSISSA